MAVFLGDKSSLAVEVGDWEGPALRRVDLWAAGQWLTCDDNMAFVRQFRREVAETAAWLRAGHGAAVPFAGLSAAAGHRRLVAGTGREEEDDALRRGFRAFDRWGPAVDNIVAFLFRDGERLEITWQFWREEHLLRIRNTPGRSSLSRSGLQSWRGSSRTWLRCSMTASRLR